MAATSPSEYWFADDYPNATYVSPIPGQEELVSIYERTEDGIYVLGVASISDEISHLTHIPYEPAIKVLAFPVERVLKTGQTFQPTFEVIYTPNFQAPGVPGGWHQVHVLGAPKGGRHQG